MRTGACTVQQALTAEAASVLKHSLNLARRRGHAQVTPLHVAATLLSSSYSSSNPLRRACLKSQPRHPASHPLQCRALELCFNVALNRLPTSPPPSSGSLIHPQPSLSNALIAALKRAQAHQRRGCIELQQQQQQQQPPQELQHQQQQQPLLAIKVELEQLILSILDDPSVSRVMREAGFSSTCVKSNLEEEASVFSQSSPFLLETRKDFIVQGSNFWQNHFIKLPSEQNQNQNQSPAARSSLKEDVKLVLELMLKKQGRTNAVVVGDSTSMTDGLVAELVSRVERGDVPDELKSTQFINLQISYVHLRLMSKSDVDMKVSDLRRKIGALTSDRTGGGVVICAGDLRWAVDEEARGGSCGFKPVEHMVAEMGRLLSEFRGTISHCGGAESNSKVWLLATASFQTYMRCQMRQPSLENQWALQAVMVPSGGLALSLQTSSGLESRITKTSHYPVQLVEPKVFSMKEDEKFHCCTDCASNFEKEASALKPETTETSNSSVSLPCWLQPNRPRNHQREDSVKELRRKWSRLCQSLHQDRHNVMNPLCPSMFNQNPVYRDSTSSSQTWWSGSLQGTQSKKITETLSIPFSTIKSELGSGFSSAILNSKCDWPEKDELTKQWLPELSLHSIKLPARQQVGTTLALGSTMYSDSATSKDQTRNVTADLREVRRGLQENIPWQSEAIPSIVEALQDLRTGGKKGTWILIQGSDHVAKRRIALVMAESLCGSADKLIRTDLKTCTETVREALAKDGKCVFLIEGINGVHTNSIGFLMDGLKESLGRDVSFTDAIFVLAISKSSRSEEVVDGKCSNRVLKIKLHVEGSSFTDLKRKQEDEPQSGSKKRRTGEDVLDLNLMAADDDDDDAVPSDLTHETDCGGRHLLLPQEFMESAVQFTLEAGEESSRRMAEDIVSKLRRSFDEASRSGASGEERSLVIDRSAVEELMESSGFFLESLFERWAREVLHEGFFSLTVEKGGSVRLVAEGKEGNDVDFGFMGSVLPNRIYL